MKAEVEKNGCISCEVCVRTCEEVFRIGDDGKAEAYVNPVPGGHEDHVKEAAQICPTSVIYIEE